MHTKESSKRFSKFGIIKKIPPATQPLKHVQCLMTWKLVEKKTFIFKEQKIRTDCALLHSATFLMDSNKIVALNVNISYF